MIDPPRVSVSHWGMFVTPATDPLPLPRELPPASAARLPIRPSREPDPVPWRVDVKA